MHSGDFTFPCARDGCELGVLNARHWLPLSHGRTTWPPVGQPIARVAALSLIKSPLGNVPSPTGRDSDRGRAFVGPDRFPIFVLGLSFFMDGFVCRVGGPASAGGVYMLCLSWMFRHRVRRHAVRPMSLAPTGVDSDLVLREILDDLVEGTTVGWVVCDPDGCKVRVLADVALFIGDYKQVPRTGHLMGHNANAPCPLCSFTKQQGEGAHYAGQSSSLEVSLVRTTGQTLAVVGAAREVMRNAGAGSEGRAGASSYRSSEPMDEAFVSLGGSMANTSEGGKSDRIPLALPDNKHTPPAPHAPCPALSSAARWVAASTTHQAPNDHLTTSNTF